MITISLCMIVRDEEETLARCLNSIYDLVDEIIIVDTGSADETKKIASNYTSKIYDFEWLDDFSVARNYSFSKANMEYILWLDADDIILEKDREKFEQLKNKMTYDIDVVMMKYDLGVSADGMPICTFFRERLLKRSKQFKWYDPVHEYLDFSGKIINSDICITHKKTKSRSRRNLNIFKKRLLEGKELSSRQQFYYARELYHHGEYDESITYFSKFLDTENGYLSNYIDACIDLSKCYLRKKETKLALRTLYRSFEYDTPRAEICCEIGSFFKFNKEYNKAIYWYKLATTIIKPEHRWGSITHDCYDYIPYMEICACYYRLGNIEKAIIYSYKAAEAKPNDQKAQHNISFLKSIK
ncbi:Glycosyl transferase, group 2 family [Candidatus Syntrophocurvum alkaliphilum]|uniref:Glycosyl transferase, group 2 family n=1 Tax=Candidatus Syntrophocurvum alkaliphilum TaxID=2293317 RepID=A0A6I6D7F6_9FIRM|nr:glycosyltransferase family 2 protein [Candidatus Syntrophocurvum alkaliphilum]QGT98597.1 Glycosyl transferase, group 2 family [Candidatus Syntrophocurvum alkaliphilum]